MPSSSRLSLPSLRWDIFCAVIDNYGDIGVCWRLARQLSAEYAVSVRLFVNNLKAFQTLCPALDLALKTQNIDGIQIIHRENIASNAPDFSATLPGDVVINAFSCHLPDVFLQAMAAKASEAKSLVWINLDYLSAENWVSACHTLPSPHLKLPLVNHFFFPGFTSTTGGLLREKTLFNERLHFVASKETQVDFFKRTTIRPPPPETILISLFSYANEGLENLLQAWSESERPIHCLASPSDALQSLSRLAGRTLQSGDFFVHGTLTVQCIPFLSPSDYDRLLWLSDLNFVRGEDSFVRAQWAAKPLLWHIYPQDEDAHLKKLAAFLDLYCENLDDRSAAALRLFQQKWNGEKPSEDTAWQARWKVFVEALPALKTHAEQWAKTQAAHEDLCAQLVRFSLSKL